MNISYLLGKITSIGTDNIVIHVKDNSLDMKVMLSETMYNNVVKYVRIGNLVGVRGKIENNGTETVMMCDRISFISERNDD